MTTKKLTKTATAITSLVTLAATAIVLCIRKATKPSIKDEDWGDDYEWDGIVYWDDGMEFTSYDDGTCTVSGIGYCTNTEITIPPVCPNGDIVTNIDWFAFSDCTSLKSVTIPDSVKFIDDGAFRGCTGLTSVTIPEGVTEIGGSAFEGCTGLKSIIIPDSVTKIGDYAFSNCTGLTSVILPKNLVRIGGNAFSGCPYVNVEWWEDDIIY